MLPVPVQLSICCGSLLLFFLQPVRSFSLLGLPVNDIYSPASCSIYCPTINILILHICPKMQTLYSSAYLKTQ